MLMYNSVTLQEYIDQNFNGSKSDFAKAQGVKLPQVYQWLKKDIVVVGNDMYSHRRKLVKLNRG